MKCSICGKEEIDFFWDFGNLPLPNKLAKERFEPIETYPLRVFYCDKCDLIQLNEKVNSKLLFSESYPYRSNNEIFRNHCKEFVDHVFKRPRGIKDILEIGGNDCTLAKSILEKYPQDTITVCDPCSNIETSNENLIVFNSLFEYCQEIKSSKYDYIIFQNSFAHLPNPRESIELAKSLLTESGRLVIELPIAEFTIDNNLWETVYFEHQFYWSINSLVRFMRNLGLYCLDYKLLPNIQGGSARFIFGLNRPEEFLFPSLKFIDEIELDKSINNFFERRKTLNRYLEKISKEMNYIVGVTASAKTASLLYSVENQFLIDYLIDDTKEKQGKFLSTSVRNIPIKSFENSAKDSNFIIFSKNFENYLRERLNLNFSPKSIFCP